MPREQLLTSLEVSVPLKESCCRQSQAISPSFAPVKHPHVCWFCTSCQNRFQQQHGGFAASPWLPAPSPCLRGPTGPCSSQADLGEDKKHRQHFHRQNRRGEAEGQRHADTRKVRRAHECGGPKTATSAPREGSLGILSRQRQIYS